MCCFWMDVCLPQFIGRCVMLRLISCKWVSFDMVVETTDDFGWWPRQIHSHVCCGPSIFKIREKLKHGPPQ
jgi:hypothetical protein